VAFALVLIGGVTYVSRHAPDATAAAAQGILSATVFSLAMIIGPGVGSWVAGSLGVPALFAVGIAASLAGVPALWLAIRGDRFAPSVPEPVATVGA
jgi:MFS family permease